MSKEFRDYAPRAPLIAATIMSFALLAACQTKAPSSQPPASKETQALARAIGETIGRCWFSADETAFAGYIYSPEPNAVKPRVLIVPKDQPAERPVLVIEATSPASVDTYGPLLDTANSARIRADLDRWAKGGGRCS
jgi:hypothetical protein